MSDRGRLPQGRLRSEVEADQAKAREAKQTGPLVEGTLVSSRVRKGLSVLGEGRG